MGKSSKLYRDYYGNIREGQTYKVSGDWNLLGGGSDGAGGPVRTVRFYDFCLPIAA